MGLAFAGSGIGTAALSPILTMLISNYGWRTTYIIAGVLIIVISLPLILFFTKKSPAEKGTIALGYQSCRNRTGKYGTIRCHVSTGKEIGHILVIYFRCHLLCTCCRRRTNAYTRLFNRYWYHPALFAGTIFGLLSLSNTVGKLILGAIFDKFRTTGGILFVGSCMTIAMVSLLLANAKSFAFVFAIAYGFSIVIATIGTSIYDR